MQCDGLIERLENEHTLSDAELAGIISSDEYDAELAERADRVRRSIYGDEVFIRGLIEFTNYCKNDCYYCGIRRSNKSAVRYRLTKDEILACCREGYRLGFRTFVLQGGEDGFYTDAVMCGIISAIRTEFPDEVLRDAERAVERVTDRSAKRGAGLRISRNRHGRIAHQLRNIGDNVLPDLVDILSNALLNLVHMQPPYQ